MSNRNLIDFQPIGGTHTNAVEGDMSADITSLETDVQRYDELGYEVSWSDGATPIGVLYVQFKIKNNWFNLQMDTMNVTGDSGTLAILIEKQSQWEKVRLFYDRTSGSGTMEAFLKATPNGV